MPVVIKGKSRSGAAQMAQYAEAKGKDNESSRIVEIRGTSAQDVRGAFAEMDAIAKGSKCGQFLYHAQIVPEKGTYLTPQQWNRNVNTLEKELGLEGHQRVVWEDTKKDGSIHQHVAWNRVDPETLKAVNMGNNYRAHERAGVKIERQCGLTPLERRPNLEGGRKADRAPDSWEYKQAERTGLNPRAIKAEVKELREASSSGKEFTAALAAHGYTLAKGDRRDFVLIDLAGGEHSLGRYAAMKAGELREFMADVDREKLPTVAQAKAAERDGATFHRTPEKAAGYYNAAIFEAFQKADSSDWFDALLEEKGLFAAKVSPEDVRRFDEARDQAKAADAQRLPPKLKEGELVAVDQRGNVHKLNQRTTGGTRAEIDAKTLDLKTAPLPTVARAQEAQQEKRNAAATERKAAREEKAAMRPEWEAPPAHKFKARSDNGGFSAARGVGKIADVFVDTAISFLANLGGGSEKKITPAEYLHNTKARQEYNQQRAEEARREAKREDALDDLRSGKRLDVSMLSTFNRRDLEEIRDNGAVEGVQRILHEQERQREERQRELTRER